MKRLHVHVAVENLNDSIRFYTGLFGADPTVLKDDYAKWMMEDPRVNFAISSRGRAPGLDHLGIQVESESELQEVASRLKTAETQIFDEGTTTCCYAESTKAWVLDPQGIAWETFLTTGSATTYGNDNSVSNAVPLHQSSACCAPAMEPVQIELKRK